MNNQDSFYIQDSIFLTLIDETPEFERALKFACLRAKRVQGHVALLYVCEGSGFHHWVGVKNLADEEQRVTGEKLLNDYGVKVLNWSGLYPIFYIVEGDKTQELFHILDNQKDISAIILGVSADKKSPGPVISHLVGKGKEFLHIPLTLIPPNMSDEDMLRMA